MNIQKLYLELSNNDTLPQSHIRYLISLKESGFEPKVIYDIGSCLLHWAREAQKIWPDAEIILFEANPHCEFLYNGYKYHMGLLSSDNSIKNFYFNEFSPGGASYYREIGSPHSPLLYPENKYITLRAKTLDDVVSNKNFPLPDFVKMDVQGAERDIFIGGINTISHAKHLILELPKPDVVYNLNAPSAKETMETIINAGWKCTAPLFCENHFDGDYGFMKN